MSRRHGATPLHLLAHLAALALAGWALLQVLDLGNAQRVLLWLVGAVVAHDLLLWPGYTLIDRAARRATPAAAVNHVRVPAGIAALLALAFFPIMCGKGERDYTRVSGLEWTGYAERWLLVSAALFAISAAVLVVRSRR